MAQLHTISRNNTTVTTDYYGRRFVTLHHTNIVTIHPDGEIVLDTGGWLTTTTMTRMNQVANEWGLGFRVSRAGGEFSVRLSDGTEWVSLDGRTISIPSRARRVA